MTALPAGIADSAFFGGGFWVESMLSVLMPAAESRALGERVFLWENQAAAGESTATVRRLR